MSQSDYNESTSDSIANSDQESVEDSSKDSSDSSHFDSTEDKEEDVWARMQHQAMERHQQDFEVMVQKYKQNGDSDEVAHVKANNALLNTYRKELREVLFEQVKWMHHLKKDPTYKKIMATKQNLMDVDDYSWEEATESAIHQRKYLLNKLFVKEEVPHENVINYETYNPYSR